MIKSIVRQLLLIAGLVFISNCRGEIDNFPSTPIETRNLPTITPSSEIKSTPPQMVDEIETVIPLKPTRIPTPTEEDEIFFQEYCGKEFVSAVKLLPEREINWFRYNHYLYPFSIAFPSDWNLIECDNSIYLFPDSEPSIRLAVRFKYSNEKKHILRTGVPAGDAVHVGTVQFVGQTIRKTIIRYEGKDKVVLYGYKEDLPYQIPVGNLIFTISLDDVGSRYYEDVELSPEIQQLADAIVESIRLTSP
ncbi:hypothetical protein BECAL_00225 [Bellilinea caldifistulae]|uniref:hypothetical protein n=1 Tax=Bellilinea caldifistulae TaxID=360411 RepID=UPI0011AEA16B|nr:hypothetical protein [Bellilinea caldifistulae]GAP09086.1 hypothetical protein BECAL_00225 [Bellilinea caldifistulae]